MVEKNNISYKKEFGQHFLYNPQIHKKIISFVIKHSGEINSNLNIIEIGPGAGHLSCAINECLKPKKFFMIEKDLDLKNTLITKFNLINNDNNKFFNNDLAINLIFQDIMKFDFLDLIKNIDLKNEKLFLISNLPYNISTKLLLNIFEIQWKYNIFDIITVLVQKEVANRFCYSDSGLKNSGKLNILASLLFSKISKDFDIGPKNFTPSPKVDSTLISFIKKSSDTERKNIDFNSFHKFLELSFSSPRKTILNNLKSIKNITDIFIKSNINQMSRPEDLNHESYMNLFLAYKS